MYISPDQTGKAQNGGEGGTQLVRDGRDEIRLHTIHFDLVSYVPQNRDDTGDLLLLRRVQERRQEAHSGGRGFQHPTLGQL